jgi:hypothetical protein
MDNNKCDKCDICMEDDLNNKFKKYNSKIGLCSYDACKMNKNSIHKHKLCDPCGDFYKEKLEEFSKVDKRYHQLFFFVIWFY